MVAASTFLIPLIGKYIDDLGVRPISITSDSCKIIGCLFLLLTYFTSDLMIAISFGLVGSLISIGNSQTLISYEKFIYIISSPILLFSIFIAIGNNMFDGLIESSGTALIDQAMSLPIKYYGFIDIVAGIFGVLGTYLYSYLNQYISRILLIIISISIITISSSLLVFFQSSITIFIICYAISIIGKVFSGNILRLLRIEIIPINQLASISSLMILLNQMILPIVGGLLFFSTGEITFIYTLMIIAIGITLINGILLAICLKRSTISS